MRLAFMGTPEFALPTLSSLIEAGRHEITGVITQPDKPKGRGRHFQAPPVKQLALEKGIPVLQPERLGQNIDIYGFLEGSDLDAVIVVAYGKMIPEDMLKIPAHGFINVHASILPCFRGAAPINWAILSGCTVTGVSIMRIDKGMDSGPVLLKQETPIEEGEDAIGLAGRLSVLGAAKLMEALDLLEAGKISETRQDHEKATYAPMLKKDQGKINWENDPLTIHNMIRALVPWPCAYTYMGSKTLKIWAASYMLDKHDLSPGTLIKDGSTLLIACSGGFVLPQTLQVEGKKAMDAQAFSCGIRDSRIMLGKGALS